MTITKENAKDYLPLIKALSEGKEIEYKDYKDEWGVIEKFTFSDEPSHYRIKPEIKHRPFKSKEECWEEMKKFQPFSWVKDKYTDQYSIISILEKSTDFDFLFRTYTFIDGTPFGIKEE